MFPKIFNLLDSWVTKFSKTSYYETSRDLSYSALVLKTGFLLTRFIKTLKQYPFYILDPE